MFSQTRRHSPEPSPRSGVDGRVSSGPRWNHDSRGRAQHSSPLDGTIMRCCLVSNIIAARSWVVDRECRHPPSHGQTGLWAGDGVSRPISNCRSFREYASVIPTDAEHVIWFSELNTTTSALSRNAVGPFSPTTGLTAGGGSLIS